MDIMKLGAELLSKALGIADTNMIQSALTKLLGGSDGKLDLGSLLSGFKEKGLGSLVSSWLGDGDNKSLDASQVTEMFGGDKIRDFATEVGTDESSALNGLKDVIPQLIDKSSSGGNLLDSLGGLGGLAGKLFG